MNRYILTRIGNAHVAWFEKSNQWVQLNAPQHEIFLLYTRGAAAEEAVQQLSHQFPTLAPDARVMVSQLYSSLEHLLTEGFPRPDFSQDAEAVARQTLHRARTHHYRVPAGNFSVSYGSEALWSYIHPGLAHAEVPSPAGGAMLFELFPFNNRFALRLDGHESFTTDEMPQVKRLFFEKLASYLYPPGKKGWLAHLHASAVSRNGKPILLASPSGSGKSTLAALLLKAGCDLFADDYLPVCREKELVYPFPPALCIKSKGMHVMQQENIHPHNTHQGHGYFLPQTGKIEDRPARITDMVFVRYKSGASLKMQTIPAEEILHLFMQESWVADDYEGAQQFVGWFRGIRFHQLEYSRNEEGVRAVMALGWG